MRCARWGGKKTAEQDADRKNGLEESREAVGEIGGDEFSGVLRDIHGQGAIDRIHSQENTCQKISIRPKKARQDDARRRYC